MTKILFIITLTTLPLFLGCTPTVKVEAPDKPIVVNLNVKVEHKLKLKIDKDLDTAMKENSDIF